MSSPYFLDYQVGWLKDQSRFKVWEKSRRIGATYVQSYEDVKDAARKRNPIDTWFTSADQSAAAEYIRYCSQWAKLFDIAANDLGEVVIDSDKDIKAMTIEFATGKRVYALSSNPKGFRSKGGKVVIDEYAFHAQPEELWKAALPLITWGFPIRVLSTYNGKGNRYYRIVADAKKGNKWSLHTTTIVDAVDDGLAEKILTTGLVGRVSDNLSFEGMEALYVETQGAINEVGDKVFIRVLEQALNDRLDAATLKQNIIDLRMTDHERNEWLEELRDAAGDEETWQQEYLCNPVDEATAWLTWDLIISAEHEDAGKPELYQSGDCYVGMDIGRRRDLTVIWVSEMVGDVLTTREVIRMKNAKFAEQDAELDRVMNYYKVVRCCMDQGGMGEKPVEDAKERHGEYKVEGVLFTNTVKQELATVGKQKFEDRQLRTPADRAIRESHHAVRKTTTTAGNPRFDADRSELGHADEFWAHMLVIHAATDSVKPAAGVSVETNNNAFNPSRLNGRQHSPLFNRR